MGSMLAAMDAAQALADLTEVSAQIEAAAVVAADGTLVAATDEARGAALARAAVELLAAAEEVRPGVRQLEAATRAGSVFVVRGDGTVVVAATTPKPTSGLVFYDLRTCLRAFEEKPKRRRAPRRKKGEEGDAPA